jgi:glycosyltransferase involved in cell wall biosynthesis
MAVTGHVAASVVVATRNRASALVRLLEGLRRQVEAPPFEVIVADNGSTDDTPAVLAAGSSGAMTLRVIRVEQPG